MNDFTRDEQHILFKCIRLSEIDYGECPDLDNVKIKLQSMIDSYCEHEDDGMIYTSNPPQNKCKKCREFYR